VDVCTCQYDGIIYSTNHSLTFNLFSNRRDHLAIKMGSSEEQYFSELLGYSLDRLSKEPELLAADIESLKRSAADAAVTQYSSFIEAAHCAEQLQTQLNNAAAGIDALLEDLPNLAAIGEKFRADAAEINARRSGNRQLQTSHLTILELLEVPQLMETCIRAGNFDEALDLRSFASKVSLLHSGLPVVARLTAEAEHAALSMRDALLTRLSGPVQLPDCLRIVGYLRRLALFDEYTLRRSFLAARENWIFGLIIDLDESHPYEFLKRLTDVYRLHLFDIIMQYNAIFSDNIDSTNNNNNNNNSSSGGGEAGTSGILYSWADRRVTAYLAALSQYLFKITDGGGLASVLDHAMHAGASLGRVGLDFRPAIAPLFEQAALCIFESHVKTSTVTFITMLDAHKWIALSSSSTAATTISTTTTTTPPATLMQHPPLAVYTNGLLVSLNELRHCAMFSLKDKAAAIIQKSLETVAATLAEHHVKRSLTTPGEVSSYQAACSMASGTMAPFVATCFDKVYHGGGEGIDLKKIHGILSHK